MLYGINPVFTAIGKIITLSFLWLPYLFVVNLHVGHFDLVADGMRTAVGGNPLEERVAEARDEPLLVCCTHHSV